MRQPEQVAAGVWRFTDGGVNWYGVESAGRFVLVDCGWPRSRGVLLAGLRELGREPHDVERVLLTHGHPDHLGSAAWLAAAHGVSVEAHRDELPRVRGERPSTRGASLITYLWRPAALRFVAGSVERGVLRPAWPQDPVAVEDAAAGVTVVATPGHTEGHAAYLLPGHGVVFTGDALVTRDVLTGASGPRLHPAPFQVNLAKARQSLAALAALDAELLLPGHGEPHRGSPAGAVAQALRG